MNRWIEFVAESDQEYRAKTREALRLGFVVHWVFHAGHSEQIGKARDALTSELRGPFSFGEYNPDTGSLDVGDPVTFKNFRFPVESMGEFEPRELLGYRRGMARIDRVGCGYDLGMFSMAGVQRRILANVYGTEFCAVAPSQSVDDATWGFPTRDGVERLIEANDLTRLGPVRRDK
ncbi:hypothetical protein [Halorubrum trueperi]|uniref:hypothetical protein n=1 Tax=Halorubrum trueperi TaxID=2004704 RepID=UPI0036D33A1E